MTAIYDQSIEKAIKDWIETKTSLVCIAERQKIAAPRPTGDFCSYLLGPAQKLGYDDLEFASGAFSLSGPRILTLSISIYADDALDKASILRNSLELDSVRSGLKTAGIHPQRIFSVLDTSALLETGFERRATLDLTICTTETTVETIGYIDEVEITKV